VVAPVLLLAACAPGENAATDTAAPCPQATFESLAAAVQTGDGQGHGPDTGSDEWQSTVEFRLGVRGNPDVPNRGTQAWCDFVNELLDDTSD
jgi:hypothetical protein